MLFSIFCLHRQPGTFKLVPHPGGQQLAQGNLLRRILAALCSVPHPAQQLCPLAAQHRGQNRLFVGEILIQ
ncbi:hypothetical protein A9D60_10205 [Leisingera sp. JC1]|nr:hypothetical protein A9D60_10205 [Leisingera sp. JC1]